VNFLKQISIYSLSIGVGVGIIITSIFNIVYIQLEDIYLNDKKSTFQQTYNKNTNITDDIKYDSDKIKELENFNNENNLEVDMSINNNIINTEYNKIFISKGMKSEEIARLLETEGIIESAREFNNTATKLEITKKIQYGLKTIPVNSSLDEIILILTKK